MEDLLKEVEQIQAYLCEQAPTASDPHHIKDVGDILSAYIARTGEILAIAKQHLNQTKRIEVLKVVEELISLSDKVKPSAKLQNELLTGLCQKETHLVDFCEQVNKTAKYQLEWCRSKLSYAKQEMASHIN